VGTPFLNHSRAAETSTIGARQRQLWLTLCSPLPFPCTAETSPLSFHPHNTTACNHPPPHTHTLHTATLHVTKLDKIVFPKYSSHSHQHGSRSVDVPSANSQPWRFANNSLGFPPYIPCLFACFVCVVCGACGSEAQRAEAAARHQGRSTPGGEIIWIKYRGFVSIFS